MMSHDIAFSQERSKEAGRDVIRELGGGRKRRMEKGREGGREEEGGREREEGRGREIERERDRKFEGLWRKTTGSIRL